MLLCGGNLDLLEPGKLRGLWGEEDFEQAAAKNEVNDADWSSRCKPCASIP